MKHLIKLCFVALAAFFITACDNSGDVKSDLTQLQAIDSNFETAMLNNTEAEKVLPLMQEIIEKYSELKLKTPEVKKLRDDSMSILKDTMTLALAARDMPKEEVIKQGQALVDRGQALKTKKVELEKKLLQAK